MLAAMNTGLEYGFGAIIAALPGFVIIAQGLQSIPNPLINEAVTINLLAGIIGSSSGGMRIALAAMADTFVQNANAAGIPLELLHRVASMAAGGMDTLPQNGAAVISVLAVTRLSHKPARHAGSARIIGPDADAPPRGLRARGSEEESAAAADGAPEREVGASQVAFDRA